MRWLRCDLVTKSRGLFLSLRHEILQDIFHYAFSLWKARNGRRIIQTGWILLLKNICIYF